MTFKRKASSKNNSDVKKPKREIRDPFQCLPDELHNYFLNQLNGEDVKKLSEVSTSYYAYTASSKCCMGKIRLSLCEKFTENRRKLDLTTETLDSIFNTTRKYSAVKLSLFRRENFDKIVPFLALISDSLVELEFDRIRGMKDPLVKLKFPKLASLKFRRNPFFNEVHLFDAIAGVPLQKLKVDTALTDEAMLLISTSNVLKTSLKELTVNLRRTDVKYFQNLSFLQDLNLKKLTVNTC